MWKTKRNTIFFSTFVKAFDFLLLFSDKMKLDEYRRMMEINGSENRYWLLSFSIVGNPHDNKSSDKWDIALQQNSTITLSITVVNAFSVEAIVTVSTPSHVWCEALKHGDVFDVNSLLLTDRQQYISSIDLYGL